MSGLCNHTSVGILVEDEAGRYLLFDRQKFPLCTAPAAGHVDEYDGIPDGDDYVGSQAYLDAAVRELGEETGILVRGWDLDVVLHATTRNPCGRKTVDGGPQWHAWTIYTTTSGGQQPRGNGSESRNLAWYTPGQISGLRNLQPVWEGFMRTLGIIR